MGGQGERWKMPINYIDCDCFKNRGLNKWSNFIIKIDAYYD